MKRLTSCSTFALLFVVALALLPGSARALGNRHDPAADSVMRRVFSYARRTGLRQQDFFADVYHQVALRTERKNPLLKLVPGMSHVGSGVNDYFGESHFRLQVHPNGEVDAKEYAYAGTASWMRNTRYRIISRYSLSIYNTKLFVDQILSPLHRRNRRYYRYSVEGTQTDSTGVRLVTMSVRPHFYNTQLVRGTFVVEATSGAVRSFDFRFLYALTHIHIRGTMGREGQSRLMPEQLDIDARFRLVGNKVQASYHALTHYLPGLSASDEPQPRRTRFDLTRRYLLRVDTTQIIRKRAYFDTLRPFPLAPAVAQKYAQLDSLEAVKAERDAAARGVQTGLPITDLSQAPQPRPQALTPLLDRSLQASRRKGMKFFRSSAEDFFFSSHRYDFNQELGEVKLPPILTPEMFSYTGSKGFILQTKIRLDLNLARQRELHLRPKASYSFKQHQFYWRVPLTFLFWPRREGTLNLEVGNGNRIYSSTQAEAVRDSLKNTAANYDSLTHVLKNYAFNYYKDLYAQADVSFMPWAGLKISLGARFHKHTLVGWSHLAEHTGMLRYIRSFAPRLHIDWTPCQYYYRQGARKVLTRSHWPTFRFDYERGIRLGSADTKYERFEFDTQYTKALYALRAIYVRAGFGLYTSRGDNYFLDYDYFRDENLLETWADGMSGKFYSLDQRWYNESKYYVRLSATYESPMLLFSRLRFLSKIIQKERLYYNTVFVSALHPYTEFGYGISSHFVDLSVFGGMGDHRSARLGLRVVFHWFSGW